MKISKFLEFTNLINELKEKNKYQNKIIFSPNEKINSITFWINQNLGLSSFIFRSLIHTIYFTSTDFYNNVKDNCIINNRNLVITISKLSVMKDEVSKLYFVINNTIKATVLFLENIDKEHDQTLSLIFLENIKKLNQYLQNIMHLINTINNEGTILIKIFNL